MNTEEVHLLIKEAKSKIDEFLSFNRIVDQNIAPEKELVLDRKIKIFNEYFFEPLVQELEKTNAEREKIIQENCKLLRENQELKTKHQESKIGRREMAARFAEGLIASGTRLHWNEKSIAVFSVRCADSIEEELNKQQGKKDGEV